MTASNKALKGLAYRSTVPAVSGYWQQSQKPMEDWGWRQIIESEEDIGFSPISTLGEMGLRHMTPCTPFRVWNEIREYSEGISSDEGLHLTLHGDEVFVDFGRFGDEIPYNPLNLKSLWQDFTTKMNHKFKAYILYYKYGFLLDNREEVRSIAIKIERIGDELFDDVQDSLPPGIFYSYAEPLDRWYAEFNRLDLAKDIWSTLTNEEFEDSKKIMILRNRIKLFFSSCSNSMFMELKDYFSTIKFDYEDKTNLVDVLDSPNLESQMVLLTILVSHGIGNVETNLSFDEKLNVIQHLIPKNLCGAVWIQFAEFMSEGGKILNCLYCQQPFIRLRGQHRDKTYCTGACKQKAWRNSPGQKEKRQKRDQP